MDTLQNFAKYLNKELYLKQSLAEVKTIKWNSVSLK